MQTIIQLSHTNQELTELDRRTLVSLLRFTTSSLEWIITLDNHASQYIFL